MMEKSEVLKKIEMLELIIKFHTEYGVIKGKSDRDKHIDGALEELSRLYKKLRELENK